MEIREVHVKTIINKGRGMYTANPYGGCTHTCTYCYARYMHDRLCHEQPWGQFLDVKYWDPIPQSLSPGRVFISTVTDPYNEYETDYGRTHALLQEMLERKFEPLIVTKSDLVLKDFDLFLKFQNPVICFSIMSLDEDFIFDMESAPKVVHRLDAMRMLHDCGIRTGCFIAPIFPGLTRPGKIIERVKEICDFVVLDPLNLRCDNKTSVLQYIKDKHNDLWSVYHDIYVRGNYRRWMSMLETTKQYATEKGYLYTNRGIPYAGPFTIVGFQHWR